MIKAGGWHSTAKIKAEAHQNQQSTKIEPYVDMKILCLTNILQVRSTLSNNQCDISAKVVLFDFKSNTRKVAKC